MYYTGKRVLFGTYNNNYDNCVKNRLDHSRKSLPFCLVQV